MLNAIDVVNIREDIKCLKSQFDDMISQYHEIVLTLVRLEYFLDHFEDIPIYEEDLPL